MPSLPFLKMTGAGNDFVLVDNRSGAIDLRWEKIAPRLCDRRYGIGADGLLVLRGSTVADFRMDYYNSDGSFGGMCGNGGRCAAAFVMNDRQVLSVTFDALDFRYSARREGNGIVLAMKDPTGFRQGAQVALPEGELKVHFVDSGAPHAVIFVDEMPLKLRTEVAESGISRIGTFVRHHAEFAPAGTNVDFIELKDATTIAMRTYERGVEEETLACGTGAVASAVVTSIVRGMPAPVTVRTRSNEELKVNFHRRGGSISGIELSGPAKVVFKGEYPLDEAPVAGGRN